MLPVLRREYNETRRYIKLMAWLNTEFERRELGRIIITGGFAVEVYSGRIYRTMDVDIIVEGKACDILEALLKRIGERIGRGYLLKYEELELKSIDIVSRVYNRRLAPVKLQVDELYVYLDPPEALITTYLAGWKFWDATEDRDKAIWLLAATKPILKIDVLNKLAKESDVADKLNELFSMLMEVMQEKGGGQAEET